MGKTLYKLHFYSAAISYFDRIVQKGAAHPHYNETLQWLAALTRDVPDSAGVLEKIGKYDRTELENPQLSTVRDELYFLLGKFNYQKNKFKEAVELFNIVNPKSPFYVQAKLFEGATHVREYNAKPAVEAFKEVLRVAEDSSDPKVRPFQDLANLSLARVFYSTGQFVLATKYFDRVSPDSYDWPNSLFESSWANFMLKQAGYSKALGNIHTLRAPFFEYFIKPESAAEALTVKATIYFYNCLFDRATRRHRRVRGDGARREEGPRRAAQEERRRQRPVLRRRGQDPHGALGHEAHRRAGRARRAHRPQLGQALRVRARARQGDGPVREGRCGLEVDRGRHQHLLRHRREPRPHGERGRRDGAQAHRASGRRVRRAPHPRDQDQVRDPRGREEAGGRGPAGRAGQGS